MCSADTQDGSFNRFTPSDASVRLALHAAHAGIWEWDRSSNRNQWSDEVWPLYGLSPEVHPASYDSWLFSIHPGDRERVLALIQQACDRHEPFEAEWRTHPDLGPPRWILSRGEPSLSSDGGRIANYTGIVMDITSRKQSEAAIQALNAQLEQRVAERTRALGESRRLLQTMLDGMPGLIGYWDHTLHNRFANRAYREWFGMPPDAIHGRHIVDLLGQDLYDRNLAYIQGALSGEPQRFIRDIPVPGRPDEFRISETHYLPDIHHGVVHGFLVLVLDVTEVRVAERIARAASQAKSEFLANISHELRTPLNAMFGLAQIGARDSAGTPASRTFQQILESGQHLLALIDDVLDFSKIEAGKMQLQLHSVDIGQLIEHVIGLTALRASAKGLQLIIDEGSTLPARAQGDATRLAQIMVNLLTNAIKFTDRGEVRLRMAYEAPDLLIQVQDSGIGIHPDRLADLYQPFVQAHEDSARQGGTGLGLAICKRLVQLMGGDIQVDSRVQQGSTFTVRVPLDQTVQADFAKANGIVLLGFPDDTRQRLAAGLRARGCACECHHLLPQHLPRSTPLLIHEPALAHLDVNQLNSMLACGHRIVVNLPASPRSPICPSGTPLGDEAVVLTGPLSPMRVLHALSRPTARPDRPPRHRLLGTRILAAEDNPVNRLILEQMLGTEGAEIRFAVDGGQALDLVQEAGPDAFDIVLCDLQMPVMDGYETTRRLQSLAPGLPVVGLTAHAFLQAREQALAAGMVDYLTKPYMLDTLVDVVRRHARPRSSQMNTSSASSPQPQAAPARDALARARADLQAMRQHYLAQPGLLAQLQSLAAQSLPGVLESLRLAQEGADLGALAKVAHEIKGTALNLRTSHLSALAADTQDQARQGEPASLARAAELAATLSAFLAELARQPDSVDEPVRADVPQDGRGDLLD